MTTRTLLIAPAVVLALAACGGGQPGPAAPPAASSASAAQQPAAVTETPTPTTAAAEPRTEAAARALAEEESARFSSGDYEGAWELWRDADKHLVTETDYARYHHTCTQAGVPLKVDSVRLTNGGRAAVVRVSALGFKFSYRPVYEGGRWRWHNNDEQLKDYAGGVDALIAKQKKVGTCTGAGG